MLKGISKLILHTEEHQGKKDIDTEEKVEKKRRKKETNKVLEIEPEIPLKMLLERRTKIQGMA